MTFTKDAVRDGLLTLPLSARMFMMQSFPMFVVLIYVISGLIAGEDVLIFA
ncbi:hypothetical protein RHECNPAF_440034 [Rhizobium etli CNPAF512]|nr:hypothetical protein RHECNPAF_440034 [Rhizobium etli CNPAF512]